MALSDDSDPLPSLCPACNKIGDLVHVGRVFYGVCHQHKFFWFIAEKPHLSLTPNVDQQDNDGRVSAMLKSYFDTWLGTAKQINAGEFDMAPEEQRQQLARMIRRLMELPGNSTKELFDNAVTKLEKKSGGNSQRA
jgi:hypothetical protein